MKLFKQPELFLVQENGDAFSEGNFPTLEHAYTEGLYSFKEFYVAREVWDIQEQEIKRSIELFGKDKKLIGVIIPK